MNQSTGRELRAELDAKSKRVERELLEHVVDRGRLAVVQAPPGSGKTWLLLRAVQAAHKAGMRVAIATQTNSQADDICRRLAKEYPRIPAVRFAGASSAEVVLGDSISWETSTANLPAGCCVVIGTAAKWGLVTVNDPFDVLFVEEAWQLAWADFMLLGQVAPRFVLIGDPGQIPPVVTLDVSRWETSPRPPHRAAPQVVLNDTAALRTAQTWSLPATRRLPWDSAALVQSFYDFAFSAYAGPGDRQLRARKGGKSAADRAIDLLSYGSTAGITLPTPVAGPPMDVDTAIADLAAEVVKRLLARDAVVHIDGKDRPLEPEDIGLVSTHRVMNSALQMALPAKLQRKISVDTPERWQGLQKPVMIVVHPMSGVVNPSSFDLETGRLCVMASRHLAGMIVLTRDHLSDTLGSFIPAADQPIGRPDVAGRGLYDNLNFWEQLITAGRVARG